MPHRHLPPAPRSPLPPRPRISWLALLTFLVLAPGCVQKAPPPATVEEDDVPEEDVCVDDACLVDDAAAPVDATPDVKKDGKGDATKADADAKVDASPDGDAEPDLPPDVAEDDEVGGTDDVEDATDEPDSETDAADGVDAAPDVDASVDAATDTGPITNKECKVDADCTLPLPACVSGYKCLKLAGKSKCVAKASEEGTPCSDGNACTTGDHCAIVQIDTLDSGQCVGAPAVCDDGNPCTQETCDKISGCLKPDPDPMESKPCNDGDNCTSGEVCKAGKCDAGEAVKKCGCKTDSDCKVYDDADLCNGKLACSKGFCVVDPATVVLFDAAKGLACDPAGDNPCQVNTCDPKVGKCAPKLAVVGTSCSDNNACTANDQCHDGACVGTPVDCDDKNVCTSDSCDNKSGCSHTPNSFECDDGDDLCTSPAPGHDYCQDGKCVGAPADNSGTPYCACKADADCKGFDVAGDLCQGFHTCQGGKCAIQPGSVVQCPYSKGVCFDSVCQPLTGQCEDIPKDDSFPCSDGNACTVGEHCQGGTCVTCTPGKDCGGSNGVSALLCDDGNPCTDDSCYKFLGCLHTPNSIPCDDGNPCTSNATDGTGDHCSSGGCVPGVPACVCSSAADCDKLKSFNKCITKSACLLASDGTSQCVYDNSSFVPCPAGDQCVTFACNPGTGKCDKAELTGPSCSDKDGCTVNDQCLGGTCLGSTKTCDDGNPCTTDTCAKDCVHSDLDGFACDDGKSCSTGEKCSGGKCAGQAVACDDGNPCTADSCVEPSGCKHAVFGVNAPCDDGNACTGEPGNNQLEAWEQDHCTQQAQCVGGKLKNCDTGNACIDAACLPDNPTAISAGPKKGCVLTYNEAPCEDGNPCLGGDHCTNGTCQASATPIPFDCNDGNPCTKDYCVGSDPKFNEKIGCNNPVTADPCSDGNICTTQDVCGKSADGKGVCTGVPLNCDDQNSCTLDSCDPKSTKKKPDGSLDGCTYVVNTASNPCGGFAECSSDATPKCVFPPGQHLLISEVYVGNPADAADDFVEIHNPTNKTVDLGDYVLQKRPVYEEDVSGWIPLAALPKGVSIPAHGYFLVANGATTAWGIAADLAKSTVNVSTDLDGNPVAEWQLRVYDTPHQLAHDYLCWSSTQKSCNSGTVALPQLVTPTQPWFSAGSLERKAGATSTRESMYLHAGEWLAGNDYDTDSGTQDFVVRWGPEPQGLATYEPACGGSCDVGKACDFKAGGGACQTDTACAVGCGSGKTCSITGCFSLGGALVSEIYVGSPTAGQFLELHNGSAKPVDFSGFVLQVKAPAALQPSDPWTTLMQFPAGTSIPPGRYFTVASRTWAEQAGGVDVVRDQGIPLAAGGGAVRLWDPRTDTNMDLVGWGSSATSSGKPAPALGLPNAALERKAKDSSTVTSLAAGGSEWLAGNDQDTDTDFNDWLVNDGPTPQSFASGVYEPACKGTCALGFDCTYTPGAEVCHDTSCGGTCTVGSACNVKSGVCDQYVTIAEFAAEGPQATDQTGNLLFASDNEYVVLYNPSGASVNLFGLALQYYNYDQTKWSAVTEYGCTACADASKPCQPDPNTGWCPKPVNGTPARVLAGYIEPYSYYLIAPAKYDSKLPTPDFVTSGQSGVGWNLSAENSGLRLIRIDGKYPGTTNSVADSVAWGSKTKSVGQGLCSAPSQEPVPPGVGLSGAVRRKPWASATATAIASPGSAAYYGGAGSTSSSSCNDFVALPNATPASQKCTRAPRGSLLCGDSIVHQRP